ncbi:hypothetical protein BJY21_003391 [Kineosphaera limosa]|uniref:hypothetical protein n=1 Tax=Kineosphaera limosa TaxID=111564 RepID=UPI0012FB6504|nr:hypothetical protein [Kineosphaera limosa]NYE02207.1 hypothetical protein [Kineosphaera limosa]
MLPLSACGSMPGPGVAAVVDGQRINESDLDAIAADFAKVQGAQAPSRTEIVSVLVARPFVLEALGARALSEQGVKELLGRDVPEVTDPTVQFVQAISAQQQLDQQTAAVVQTEMAAANIEVSPRYGAFEPGEGVVPVQENWIVPAADGAAPTP